MKCIAFPKIEQFRNVVAEIEHKSTFTGLDSNNKPIYDSSLTKPTISFTGTVKLHGTNASIRYHPIDGIFIQSRSLVYEPNQPGAHMGFNRFVHEEKKNFFINLMKTLYKDHNLTDETLILYGEWAGKGIQKSVAVSDLEKAFYLFGLKISPINEENYWVDMSKLTFTEPNVHNIYQFPTWKMDIDFNNPKKVLDELIRITNEVEQECPVSKKLGISGCGEGVVWTGIWRDENFRFKVKGEKHAISHTKQIVQVSPETMDSINSFVEYSVTENRVNQGIKEVASDLSMKKLGNFIRWMINDIMAEESDVLKKSNLEWKQVSKHITNRSRQMFIERNKQL